MLTQELLLLLQRELVENLPEQPDGWMSGRELPFVNGILQRHKWVEGIQFSIRDGGESLLMMLQRRQQVRFSMTPLFLIFC